MRCEPLPGNVVR